VLWVWFTGETVPYSLHGDFLMLSNQEIIIKANQKAEANGWVNPYDGIRVSHAFDIIFSHDFAKAFWGYGKEKEITRQYPETHLMRSNGRVLHRKAYSSKVKIKNGWKMVLQEDPLQYLAKFLESDRYCMPNCDGDHEHQFLSHYKTDADKNSSA
jgi:hypothetical protein